MFKLINGQGFDITFENGCTAKVRMGVGIGDHKAIATDVPDAEKAVMDVNGDIQNGRAMVTVVNSNDIVIFKSEDVSPDYFSKILKAFTNVNC